MDIKEFIGTFKNHPVLFIGTGISLRYLENSFTWDGLLSKIAFELKGNIEYYLDIKSQCQKDGKYQFDVIASKLEQEFNSTLMGDRNGKFKEINDLFYSFMAGNINMSRFKIYIATLFKGLKIRPEMEEELAVFKKVRKNIGSIITTNYDTLIESTFEFNKLIGNDILLSNPYGSVYKIHGCSSDAGKMIITSDDYIKFQDRYELIRAQLLSLFIHNPIIFMGYGIGDENIKSLLKTIFTYIEPNSEQAKIIRGNFLLVEYEPGLTTTSIAEHDIDMEGFATIRINKIKTDNFRAIYEALSDLHLPISAQDVRKVQSIVKDIYSGGSISVKITEDLDSIKNSDKILAIGSSKTITYQYLTSSETISNYFKIVDESNSQAVSFIDKYSIPRNQYFPIWAFSNINPNINCTDKLKKQQERLVNFTFNTIPPACHRNHRALSDILADHSLIAGSKDNCVYWSAIKGYITLDDMEKYLRNYPDKKHVMYKKLLCAYDYLKYQIAGS